MKTSKSSPLAVSALAFAKAGIAIFPCVPKTKQPLIKDNLNSATTSESQIKEWWGKHPNANIGMPTGAKNGRVIIDPDGPTGEDSLAKLTAQHGTLPETFEVKTGRADGGRHLHYLIHVETKSKAGLLGPKLDVKGDGGFVLLPPSIHPDTGKEYVVVHNGQPAEAPSWLIELVRRDCEKADAEAKDKVNLTDTWPIPPGERHDAFVQYAGLMVAKGWSAKETAYRLTKIYEKRCVDRPAENYKKICADIAASVHKLYAEKDQEQKQKDELPKIEFNPQPTETAIVTDEEGAVRRLEAFFAKYLVLPPGLALVLSLWTIGTHMFDLFDIFPYLAITAVAMRCGKSRVLDLIWHVSRMASYSANISPAALFRIIDAFHPTILLDEAEGLINPKSETALIMVGLLNAGHSKKAHVLRAVPASAGNAKVTLEQLNLFCPKAFTAIGKLPLTLADRSIAIRMQRRRSDQPIARYLSRKATTEGLERLAEIKSLVEKNCAAIQKEYEAVEDYGQLVDREADNWASLLAICGVIAPSRIRELQLTAMQNGSEKDQANADTSVAMLLIADLQDILKKLLTKEQLELFKDSDVPGFSSKTLLNELWQIRESPWGDEHGLQHLTAWKLSSLLRPFEVYVHKIWEGERKMEKGKMVPVRFQGYRVADLERAIGLYAPKLRTSGQSIENKEDKGENDSGL
jgi:hypothetical protein